MEEDKQILELKKVVNEFYLMNDLPGSISNGNFDEQEWNLLLGYIKIIEKFHQAIMWLKGDNYLTVCAIIRFIDKIYSELELEE